MSAEVLRRGANRIREDWRGEAAMGDYVADTMVAVADWLDAEAARWVKAQDTAWGRILIRTDFTPPTETSARNALQSECDSAANRACEHALAVAVAYLGESA